MISCPHPQRSGRPLPAHAGRAHEVSEDNQGDPVGSRANGLPWQFLTNG